MTSTPMMTLMEMWRNHHGNAYAYLSYDNRGHLVGIYPLHPQKIRIWIDNAKIFSGKEDYIMSIQRWENISISKR